MSFNLGKLKVILGLDDRQFQQGLKGSQQTLAVFGRRLAIIGTAAIGAAVAGLGVYTREAFRSIDATAKLARDLNTSTASLQVMERAGELAGVGVAQLAQGTKDLTRRLSQAADGTGPAVAALQRLGLTSQELMAMPLDQRISTINEAIEEFVPAAARAAVAGQLFGEEGSIAIARLDPATIRQAADDVARFGVAVSDVDAGQIEITNDALSRLSLIGQGLGNQIAVAVAPALQRLADWLGHIAQVGGPVNRAITLIVGNLDRLVVYTGLIVTGIGVRYVAAVTLAAARTLTLATALRVLRTAMIRTGIGAIVVLVGELVLWLDKTSDKAGGVGEMFGLLKDVAQEVFSRIGDAIGILPLAMQAAANAMSSFFLSNIADMAQAFADFMSDITDGFNAVFGTNLAPLGGNMANSLRDRATEADGAASSSSGALRAAMDGLTAPLQSMEALRAAMADNETETEDLRLELDDLDDTLENIGGGEGGPAGGGSADAAAEAIDNVAEASDRAADTLDSLGQIGGTAFEGLIAGGKSFRETLADMLRDLSSLAANSAWKSIWEGGPAGGGGLSGVIGGLFGLTRAVGLAPIPTYASGTSFHPGGAARINEMGGEIVNLPRGAQVIPHDVSMAMARSSGGQRDRMDITINVADDGAIMAIARNAAGEEIARSAPGIVRQSVAATRGAIAGSKSFLGAS